MKFCGNCAEPLKNPCPRCGFENLPQFKFCGECSQSLTGALAGTAVAAGLRASAPALPPVHFVPEESTADSLEGERKTVTTLFSDIKGSMDLIEDLDPEEARAIVDPAMRLMIDAVHRYDGYVVQSTGDGIFAIFGAPAAHEDHAQRALYAGLRMQEEMRKYSARLRERGDPPVEIRVGVNTGEVVVRMIRTGDAQVEYAPVGHSTSLASRMQTLAPTGAIVVTQHTHHLTAGYFDFKRLGPTRVKGVSEPIEIFEVVGVGPLRTRLQMSAKRGLSRFVGRQAEIDQLLRSLETARAGHGQIVAAVAEAGVGKSRLFHEFKLNVQTGCLVLEAVSVSHGKASAYLPVVDLLKTYFRITDQDDSDLRREKITGKVLSLDRTLEDTMPYLFALLGVPLLGVALDEMDPAVRRWRTRDAIKRLLVRETLRQPLILIFEDLHWIDDESQALLDLLADSIGTARVLMMVNYRTEYRHQWGNKTYYAQLRLDPLGRPMAAEMLSALLGDDAELKPLKETIIDRTEGNPFFMEEMVQVLFDEGVLVREGAVKLARPFASVHVPPTVRGILAARIDRLAPPAKDLLQTLAVIGKEFPLGLVCRVTGKPEEDLAALLSILQLSEFLYEQPAVAGTEYTFKHALTQEVAYDSMLIDRRRRIHESTASALEEMFADSLEDHLGELAHHYSRSRNVGKAVHYLNLAGQQAGRRSAYEDALAYLTDAIDLLPKMPESPERDLTELELRMTHGALFMAVRGFATPELESNVGRVKELCARLGDSPATFGGLFGLWSLGLVRARLDEAMPLAMRMVKIATPLDNPGAVGSAHSAMGTTSLWLGKFRQAQEHLVQTVAIFDRDLAQFLPSQIAPVIPARCQLAWSLWMLGYPDQADGVMARALALADQLKRPHSSAFALLYATALDDFQRDYRSIRPKIDALIEISRENGFTSWGDSATLSLGRALIFEGDTEGGIAMMLEALAGLRAHGAEMIRTYSITLIADSCLMAGQFERGLDFIQQAFASFDSTGVRLSEAETHRVRGELLLGLPSKEADAADAFRRAIEVARAQEAKSWELRATMSLARLLDREGKRGVARSMLSSVCGWFTEGFKTPDLRDAAATLRSWA